MPEVRFYVDGGATAPERVSCEGRRDETGRFVKDTHFATEGEAWDWLERDVKAQGWLVAREIERLRSALKRAETEAADTLVRMKSITEARERQKEPP